MAKQRGIHRIGDPHFEHSQGAFGVVRHVPPLAWVDEEMMPGRDDSLVTVESCDVGRGYYLNGHPRVVHVDIPTIASTTTPYCNLKNKHVNMLCDSELGVL